VKQGGQIRKNNYIFYDNVRINQSMKTVIRNYQCVLKGSQDYVDFSASSPTSDDWKIIGT
jgi:hypothetical protein